MSTTTSSESDLPDVPIEFMRRQPLFSGLFEDDLHRLYEMSSTRALPAGAVLLHEGEPGDEMYIVMSGELEISKLQGEQENLLAVREAGDVVGEMALLGQEPRSATVRAISDSKLLVIGHAAFTTLLACSDSAALTILKTVTQRLRSTESMLMQQEKLASLGTMAAGLAHELNNPAAAVGRSISQLREAVAANEELCLELGALDWRPEERDSLRLLRNEATAHPAASSTWTAAELREREARMTEWLEQLDIDDPWDLAPVLTECGWTTDEMAKRLEPFRSQFRATLVRWLAAGAETRDLLASGEAGVKAISSIVGAVRDYAYLDRAPLQSVDVRQGLDNTLLMLRSKLKSGIEVVREYTDVPAIEAYGSELNQVWTNLIDNAVDAMSGQGRLLLRVYAREERVFVEIRDDGPGIPPEVMPRIFDPFFTTKAVGSGNGLGLHIAYDLVVRRHRGRLHVVSEPGNTCFQVALPIDQPPRKAAGDSAGNDSIGKDSAVKDSAVKDSAGKEDQPRALDEK